MLIDPDGYKAYYYKDPKTVKKRKIYKNEFPYGPGKIFKLAKVAKKIPYRVKGYSKKDGRLFGLIKRSGKNPGRKFSLDYHQIRETINGKKRRSHRAVLHAHFGKNTKKHRVIYPSRKKLIGLTNKKKRS